MDGENFMVPNPMKIVKIRMIWVAKRPIFVETHPFDDEIRYRLCRPKCGPNTSPATSLEMGGC